MAEYIYLFNWETGDRIASNWVDPDLQHIFQRLLRHPKGYEIFFGLSAGEMRRYLLSMKRKLKAKNRRKRYDKLFTLVRIPHWKVVVAFLSLVNDLITISGQYPYLYVSKYDDLADDPVYQEFKGGN